MKVARDWNEFLRFAARAPEPGLSFYDENEVQGAGAWAHSGPLFDVDAVQVLNSHVPLQLLLAATRSRSLPPRLQMQLAEAGFVRSIVLRRPLEEKEFMQRMVELNPALAESAHELLSEPDADAAHFAAILLVLRSSSLSGILWPGNWKVSDLHRARLPAAVRWGFSDAYTQLFSDDSALNLPIDLGFLTPVQKQQADLEWKLLADRATCGATYLEKEALQWALKRPGDSRVPEALYLVIQATYRGCRESQDDPVGERSHKAFRLLKENYRDSQWAKKTKYWYK